jgi:hypothetical protein
LYNNPLSRPTYGLCLAMVMVGVIKVSLMTNVKYHNIPLGIGSVLFGILSNIT